MHMHVAQHLSPVGFRDGFIHIFFRSICTNEALKHLFICKCVFIMAWTRIHLNPLENIAISHFCLDWNPVVKKHDNADQKPRKG